MSLAASAMTLGVALASAPTASAVEWLGGPWYYTPGDTNSRNAALAECEVWIVAQESQGLDYGAFCTDYGVAWYAISND